jgi:EpsI family protein
MHRRLVYLPAAILLAGSALLLHARSQSAIPLAGSLDSVLPSLPGYDVTNQKLTDEERRVAGMTDYRARAFVKDSILAFTTLVSYYSRQTQGQTIHSPKNCLPGAGWEVIQVGTETVNVDGVPRVVNRYLLKKGPATALAYYWYQGRGRVTASEYSVKWNLLRDAALLGHTEEALVRVVVPVSVPSTVVDRSNERDALHRADATAMDISARLIRGVESVMPRSARQS